MSEYITLLGRQPEISLAELSAVFGEENVALFSPQAALVQSDSFDIQQLGGTVKAGRVVTRTRGGWSEVNKKVTHDYTEKWRDHDGKITLGISAYDLAVSARQLQKLGLSLKSSLKKHGVSLRLIPQTEAALSTATSHHNKLGLSPNKVELMIIHDRGEIIIAESTGAQNITALAKRDQARPRTDAFVGMLPPKLALMMLNIAGNLPQDARILDPFCGTGTVLQEAALRGFTPYGTDLSEKMVRYAKENLEWIYNSLHREPDYTVEEADAMDAIWQQPIDAVVCETYLGQPFSAPPKPEKLEQVVGNCNHIITQFLKNIHSQLATGTPLCIAVPAWRAENGTITHLPIAQAKKLESIGFIVKTKNLLYYREGQVVAREILSLTVAV